MAVIVAFISLFSLLCIGSFYTAPVLFLTIVGIWSLSILLFSKRMRSVWGLYGIAILLRLMAFTLEPTLSDDVFRYVWEGAMVLEGQNPYLSPPNDFSPPNDLIHPRINHPEVPSIYPPVAMLFFTGLSSIHYSIYPFKIMSLLADLGILVCLTSMLRSRKRDLEGAWFYALHPLPILESASSGHMESWAVCALFFGLYQFNRHREGTILIWFGAMLKLLPMLIFPVLCRRNPMLGLFLIALTILIFWFSGVLSPPEGLLLYARHWSFHASIYSLVEIFVGVYARWFCMGVAAVAVLYALGKRSLLEEKMLWIGGVFILLSPTVHPWYLLWVLPVSILCMQYHWRWLVTAYPLFYVALLTLDPQTGRWEPPLWPQLVTYIPFFVWFLWSCLDKRFRWKRRIA